MIYQKKHTFTSHYVPIKSFIGSRHDGANHIFTSHYVPIKSAFKTLAMSRATLFTSHYVPIKSTSKIILFIVFLTLHPIMFLLNPIELCDMCVKTNLYIPLCSY